MAGVTRLLELLRRVPMLLRGNRFDRELDEEMRLHLELRAKQYEAAGLSPGDARSESAHRFGHVLNLREEARAAWGLRWFDELCQDLRYGLRVMRRDPGATMIIALTLAFAIGITTAMFSVLNAVLIRPLAYHEAHRLALLWTENRRQHLSEIGTGYPIVEHWKTLNRSFDDLGICSRNHPVTVRGDEGFERLPGAVVSANLFALLGVPPLLGRVISVDDESQHRHVAVVSAAFWKRRFGSSPSVVGATIDVDGHPDVIVGVMPPEFQFPSNEIQFWEPVSALRDWETSRTRPFSHFWIVVGRLRPEATYASAQTNMTTVGRQVAGMYPAFDTQKASAVSFDVRVVPIETQIVGPRIRIGVWTLFGAVVVVLLIACINVANLLLARGMVRQREFALRTALGGGRFRLIRQLVTEALLLAGLGGMLGLGVAAVAMRLFLSLGSGGIPRLNEATIDGRVLAFTVAVSLLVAFAFGLVPALSVSVQHPIDGVKNAGRWASEASNARRMRGLLVVTEFALAMVLLAGSALFIKSLLQMLAVDAGFRPERVLLMHVEYPRGKSDASAVLFYRNVVERVRQLPGVEAAGLINRFVIDTNPDDLVTVERHEPVLNEQLWDDSVSPGYFRAVGTPLLRGRDFTSADRRESPLVAIINETMARRFWAGEDPLGRRFKMGSALSNDPWVTVVGIVGDMRRQGPERAAISQIFFPHEQSPGPGMLREVDFVVRTASNPLGSESRIRAVLRELDPTVPISRVTTLERQLDAWGSSRRFQTVLLTGFSTLALVLAWIGIYGLVQYSVTQRRREIGIRMALGADRRVIVGGVLNEGLRLAACGAAVGLLAVGALGRLVSGLLFNVSPIDPASVAGATAVLAVAGIIGCLLPARGATLVDPLVVLRSE